MEKLAIIDDEENIVRLLTGVVEEYLQDQIEIIGSASSVEQAITLIEKEKPTLLFLDINLSDGTGFDVVEHINPNIAVIFITAYQEYAVKAIKIKNFAIDYIVKPIVFNEVVETVNRVLQKRKEINLIPKNTQPKILVRTQGKQELLKPSSIVYMEGDRRYTIIHLMNNESIRVAKNLSHFEEKLQHFKFLRVHKSYLVNLNFVSSILNSGEILLQNEIQIKTSRTGRTKLIDTLSF